MKPQFTQSVGLILAVAGVIGAGIAIQAPSPPSSDTPVEPMLLHASGACLARISRLEERDERPSDGDHWVKASLDVSQSSGKVPEFLYLMVEPGGLRPPPLEGELEEKLTPTVLRHDSLQVGEQHWFVFSEHYDSAKYPPNVAGWWPYDAGTVPRDVIAAIESDRFHGNPVWDPNLNVVYEAYSDREEKTVRIVVRDADSLDDEAIRFDKTISGKLSFLQLQHWAWSYEMDWPQDERLHAVYLGVVGDLPDNNRFQQPAGTYRIQYAFDLETGRLLAAWIAANQEIWLMRAFQQYDRKTGELVTDMQFDLLESGGLTAGGESENWYRRVVRRFEQGKLISDQVFRHEYIKTGKERIYSSSGWLPVEN